MTETDYMQFRGRCKELSEAAVAAEPTLTLVRGHYHCPYWGKQAHWWTVRHDGTIYDPSAAQFPSRGIGEYQPFDGWHECEQCGTQVREEDAYIDLPHLFCSSTCYARCVGVL
jgi:hypothetical protein